MCLPSTSGSKAKTIITIFAEPARRPMGGAPGDPAPGICREAVGVNSPHPGTGTWAVDSECWEGSPRSRVFCVFVCLFFITGREEERLDPGSLDRRRSRVRRQQFIGLFGAAPFANRRLPFFYSRSSPGGAAKLYIHSSDRRQENSPLD